MVELALFKRSCLSRIIIKLFQMSMLSRRSLQDSYHTPSRRRNDLMTRSQFLTNSVARSTNPEDVRHTFFQDRPFQKFQQDRSRYRPVSYQSPSRFALDRSYVIVDQKVNYGKALSQYELDRILGKKTFKPEIITYGVEDIKPIRTRQTIEIKKEGGKVFCGCCGVDDRPIRKEYYVSRY